MRTSREEFKKRQEVALAAIKRAFGTPEDKYGATLFVSHHLEEVEESYWQKYLGTARPEPSSILNLLVLESERDEDNEEDCDTLYFTLPDDVTNYVITVHIGESGQVEEITMES